MAAIIFAETGLLVGFFLPGDTLLIAAGIFAGQGKLPILALLPVVAAAAIAGYEVGYIIGERAGPRVFKRKNGLLFREDYIERTDKFFRAHGGKTVLIARFIAVIRTIVPLTAGMAKMEKRRFHIYNIVGGILWTFSVTLASFWLGRQIPNVDKYIVYLLVLAMVVTAGSVLGQILVNKERRHAFAAALRDEFNYFIRRKR